MIANDAQVWPRLFDTLEWSAPPMNNKVATAPGVAARRREMNVLLDLRQTIAELLDVPVEHLTDSTFLHAELDTDSLMDIALVVEDDYDIRFTEAELQRFACIQDVADRVTERSGRALPLTLEY